MAYLVDGEEQVLVRRCADDICRAPETEGPERRVLQAVGGKHLDADDEEHEVFCERLWPAELGYLHTSLLARILQLRQEHMNGEKRRTSGCALMIAIRRVRCGSSVYVQKKSCSLTSRGGAASASGELRNRAVFSSLGIFEAVTVEVEAGILNEWRAWVSMDCCD
jgi:hypothetical protein